MIIIRIVDYHWIFLEYIMMQFVVFFKVWMPSHYHTRAYVENRKPYYGQTVIIIHDGLRKCLAPYQALNNVGFVALRASY